VEVIVVRSKKQKKETAGFDFGGILGMVENELEKVGIDVDLGSDASVRSWPKGDSKFKVVCVTPGLRDSVEEMSKTARDQVVMVRVDSETSEALDAWVQTGAVKSRSEAAALFIREGLNVRSDELARLKDALSEVQAARDRLRRQAREVFGEDVDVEEDH
jgi:Arc/MetJ-type ribon-helix-helix transcriptional regulator